ncbi:MAG: hypothetical protein ABH877_00760 [bacterium]
MAAGNICDRAYVVIDGTTLEFESFTVKRENSSKVVNAMTRDGNPLGVAKGNRSWVISGDLAMRPGTEDVDLDALEEDDTSFAAGVEYASGPSYQYQKAVITGLDESAGHGEECKRTVEITCWDRIKSGV